MQLTESTYISLDYKFISPLRSIVTKAQYKLYILNNKKTHMYNILGFVQTFWCYSTYLRLKKQ